MLVTDVRESGTSIACIDIKQLEGSRIASIEIQLKHRKTRPS
ncbi:hypothetical protein RESH_00543 [Rhodopirellula europaea SH398]|uniref:Uncharacterized protein n=1 Tax=Rhodopirellula europaea SH398 TaxID=1263868 RepID=M5SRI9_9BACT|nr:hypothetical protein RESH_00543 [Rhodopirellula europaea SH398]